MGSYKNQSTDLRDLRVFTSLQGEENIPTISLLAVMREEDHR